MAVVADFFHCEVKAVSRSAGRSVVAAAAYRLGERLHDEQYAKTHDYTRKRGIETAFTVAPADAPEWAQDPERLWNAAEHSEKRKNSTVAREAEIALPAFLSPEERRCIMEKFAVELVNRYGVVVSVALHEPSRQGDQRNFHAHVLFTTREVTEDGFGKKTRILDDRKTGPGEIVEIRKLAADVINEMLAEVGSDIRVDHRSFKERGINREPTTHLGPTANEMERRGEPSDRGDINRQAERNNALRDEVKALDAEIAAERDRAASPPRDYDDARRRVSEDVGAFAEAIRTRGSVADIQSADGLPWWQRVALRVFEKARDLAMEIAEKARYLWQSREHEPEPGDERGIDR